MNLDRSLIKSQAKELIKGNVFKLFVIIFVVTLLTGSGAAFSGASSATNNLNDPSTYSDYGDLENSIDEYDFNEYGDIDEFDIEDFTNDIIGDAQREATKPKNIFSGIVAGISGFASIISLFLAPLAVTLAGVFYSLIKGKNMDWAEEFGYVFGKTFDKNYWNKFLLNLITGIITGLLCLLFIIPGIVYYYKIYFVNFIMAEKPELSYKEAIDISKKMTKGHKGELITLDLSFIGWFCLTILTLGILSIYVEPYIYTTKALYYENFKLRAFQLGAMSEDDFLTVGEKINRASTYPQDGYTYQPPQPAAPQNDFYQPPVQEAQPAQDYTYNQAPAQPEPAPVEAPAEEIKETPWEE